VIGQIERTDHHRGRDHGQEHGGNPGSPNTQAQDGYKAAQSHEKRRWDGLSFRNPNDEASQFAGEAVSVRAETEQLREFSDEDHYGQTVEIAHPYRP
jgi:hypothetical protein